MKNEEVLGIISIITSSLITLLFVFVGIVEEEKWKYYTYGFISAICVMLIVYGVMLLIGRTSKRRQPL